jgi:hypothetical protein
LSFVTVEVLVGLQLLQQHIFHFVERIDVFHPFVGQKSQCFVGGNPVKPGRNK